MSEDQINEIFDSSDIDRKDRTFEIEECTCEQDAATKFLCDFCIAEIEWEKNSITDENGEVFSSVREMKAVKTYRTLNNLQKMFDSEYAKGRVNEYAYSKASSHIFDLRAIVFMMEIFNRSEDSNK